MTTNKKPMPHDEVWAFVSTLQEGTRIRATFKLPDSADIETWTGTVTDPPTDDNDPDAPYAVVLYDQYARDELDFPQDGRGGRPQVDYYELAILPKVTPTKRASRRRTVETPMPASGPSGRYTDPLRIPPPREAPWVPDTMQAPLVQSRMRSDDDDEVEDPGTRASHCGSDEYALDPARWSEVLLGPLEVQLMSMYLRSRFKGVSAEHEFIITDLVDSLTQDMYSVVQEPAICDLSTWVEGRKILLRRLMYLNDRAAGMNAQAQAAMYNAARYGGAPKWVQDYREQGLAALKVHAYTSPGGNNNNNRKGRFFGKKGGQNNSNNNNSAQASN
eukprot:PhM_4_TR18093/c1_g1_i4/m.49231